MGKLIDFKEAAKKFEIKNVSQTKAEILIYDQIGEDWFGGGITAENFTKELNNIPKTVNLIEVRINSPGGSVFEGYTIYNRLKQHKAEVHVYVDGMAASIASIIALAGDKVHMSEVAQMMIHKPSVMAWGNSKDFEDMIERLDTIENQLIKIYHNKTGLDYTELQNMLAKETWFTSEQALDFGFADEVVGLNESLQFAACANMKSFKNDCRWVKGALPIKDIAQETAKNKVSDLINDIEGFLAHE